MSYPKQMRMSVENVEKTRDFRLRKEYRRMSSKDAQDLLKKYHPDHKSGMKRKLRIGPNAGDLVPNEVANILESHPVLDWRKIDLSKIDYDVDVLIVGAGGAGITAALFALESGIKRDNILIVQKLRLGDSNSKMSQGGIQAADGSDDSPALHFIDVMGGGHFANKPELVRILVENGPWVIKWHEELGVMYSKNPDGSMFLDSGGGTCRKRVHCCKDYTGLEIMRVLLDECKNKQIPALEFTSVIELLLDGRSVSGAILYNMETGEYQIARAKSTILATGGFGRLHIQDFPTTNHYGATGDGLVLAYRAGARLRDLDATQYHPTGAAYPEQIVGQLCTEKLRAKGAQLVNLEGELFVNALEARDIVGAAIIRECYARNKGVATPTGMLGVWLDTPMIEVIHGSGTIKDEFAAMFRQFDRFGIDITKEPVLVFPTLHYQNGGVEIDSQARSSVPGLFVAGELSGGIHGKNRLMGNSQLELYVFGRIAGMAAAARAKKVSPGKLSLDHVARYEKMMRAAGIKTNRKAPILLPEYRGKKTLSRALRIM